MENPFARPFDEWTRETAQQVVKDNTDELAATNARFVDGDHWQNRAGWVGPHPGPGDQDATLVWDEIQKAFVSRNAMGEAVARHGAGVVGHEPQWALTPRRPLKPDEEPTDAEQALIDEAEAALAEWWNSRKLNIVMQRVVRTMLVHTRAPLRLKVPTSFLVARDVVDEATGDVATVTEVRAADIQDALRQIYVEDAHPDQCAVVTDDVTGREVGIYIVQDDDGNINVELVYLAPVAEAGAEPGTEPGADPASRMTIIRTVNAGGDSDMAALPLGGRLTMADETRPRFLTEQTQQSQRALNLALSMLPRNVITSGFMERIVLNASMPGHFIEDATVDGGKRWIQEPFYSGAGTTNSLTGVTTTDPVTGKQTVATPQVVFREPVDVTPTIAAVRAHYQDIMEECWQGHVLINTEATPSGKSRQEARADFGNSLLVTAERIQSLGIWLMESALAMAEAFIGQPGRYTSLLRATFECRVDTGPLGAAEAQEVRASVEAGLFSQEYGRQLLGVQDVDAEAARVQAEPGAMVELITKQAAALASLTLAGVELDAAMRIVGMTDEQVRLAMNAQADAIADDENDPRVLDARAVRDARNGNTGTGRGGTGNGGPNADEGARSAA